MAEANYYFAPHHGRANWGYRGCMTLGRGGLGGAKGQQNFSHAQAVTSFDVGMPHSRILSLTSYIFIIYVIHSVHPTTYQALKNIIPDTTGKMSDKIVYHVTPQF